MENFPEPRKRVRHVDDPGHVHELTFSCSQRLPLLTNDRWQGLLAESIDRAMERHRYRLTAFVFMPEHVHLLVFPLSGASEISSLLKAIKRPFSYRIKKLLVESGSELLGKLAVQAGTENGIFRFWQAGPGYDRNLTRSASTLAAIEYFHENPIKRGLVKRAVDWKWSSARYYLCPPPQQYEGLPKVSSLPAEWLDSSD